MIGDYYGDKWRPYTTPDFPPAQAIPLAPIQAIQLRGDISREEFEALKKEVADMKELLLRAKAYDERTGQPDCEMESKVELLKAVAKAVGVNLDEIFKPSSA
jgi:hypothetical protein